MSAVADVAGAPAHVWFLEDDKFAETGRPGFRRRVLDGDTMQIWFWRIASGSTGSFLHQHLEHEQFGVIVRGRLDFRIGEADTDERVQLAAGDIYLARRGVWHGDSIFLGDDEVDECWIVDVFSPPRTDMDGGNG